ncbi:MAG: hypothetical protein L3J16_02245 [Anaerolineales bacterium]|nr:hypothetical protein [Anaerolineales bacterium]
MKTVDPLIQKYALAISFFTLLCMVIALGIALYDIVQIVAPQLTYVQQEYMVAETSSVTMGETPAPTFKEEELTQAIQRERTNATRSLIQSAIILLLDVALFLYHWRLANRPVQDKLLPASRNLQ